MAAVGVASTCHLKLISIFLIPHLFLFFKKDWLQKVNMKEVVFAITKDLRKKSSLKISSLQI